MYAIVDIAGHQFKVEKDKKLYVNRLEGDEGSEFDLVNVLLVDNEGTINVGTPNIKDAVVKARILSHLKGDKILVFKKKRRKGYQKQNGHRQYLTQIQIEDIVL
jgi:large subunit ribosomal protein L21